MKTQTLALARTSGIALLVVAFSSGCGSRVDDRKAAAGIQRAIEKRPQWARGDALGKKLWEIERGFYIARKHRPVWIQGDDATTRLNDLLETLRASERHGLDPARYGLETLETARKEAGGILGSRFVAERVPEMELRATHAFLLLSADLLGWTTSPQEIDRHWLSSPAKADLGAELRRAADGDVSETLEKLAPSHFQYEGLMKALAEAKKSGDAQAAERISMNMERWRWTPRDLGERHIVVNVPAYTLRLYDAGKPSLDMRVIVGKPDSPTPLFSDQMTYVVFSPYWNIPTSILRAETLPRMAEDPTYLARSGIEAVDEDGDVIDPEDVDWDDEDETANVRLRQAPGEDNALGLVKFIFPNHFNVYLHDTPNHELFAETERTLSHGCIRVEKPVELAETVLADRKDWTPQRIADAMNAKQEKSVTLKKPIPVHIGYWTAWVEDDGRVTMLGDPYGLEKKQLALRQEAGSPKKSIASRYAKPSRRA